MPATLSAIFVWGDDIRACVAVNAMHARGRQRWSIAHELGHFLRDREAGDVLDREESFKSSDPSEVFAQTLAAALLMPASGLGKRFAERCRANGGRFSSFDLLDLARTYEVSFAAMALRLEELRLLPAGALAWKLPASATRPGPGVVRIPAGARGSVAAGAATRLPGPCVIHETDTPRARAVNGP